MFVYGKYLALHFPDYQMKKLHNKLWMEELWIHQRSALWRLLKSWRVALSQIQGLELQWIAFMCFWQDWQILLLSMHKFVISIEIEKDQSVSSQGFIQTILFTGSQVWEITWPIYWTWNLHSRFHFLFSTWRICIWVWGCVRNSHLNVNFFKLCYFSFKSYSLTSY